MKGIKEQIQTLPQNPGVYQFFDEKGKLIYVGKAKKIKKRVASYFTKKHATGKTRVMVKKIREVKFIVVDSELEALLLENNLIKKHQPRYNVQLKDDKTFPWICIKKERFPRVFSTRNIVKDGSEYFGPYASVKMMNTLLDLIRHLYTLRTCNYNLSEENIREGKFRVCLEYHIGNCKGPCEGLQSEEDYNRTLDEIRGIIKGNISNVITHLKKLMKAYAAGLNYEKAQTVKEKIEILEKYKSKSTVVSPSVHNIDIFSIVADEKNAFVNYMKVVNGAIVQAHTVEIKKKLEEEKEELLSLAITDLRRRFESDSSEIVVPFVPGIELPGVKFHVPQRGDKRKLLELSERNAKYYRLDKKKKAAQQHPKKRAERLLKQIKKDLRLPELPVRIECFDNSNIQGSDPVAACVVFKDGKPSKKDYRHFNIKTVEGPDDYASMEEVVYRRYRRLIKEEKKLPQLIVIDGGKGQLSAAVKSLERLNLRGKISIIGIAKRLEEIYFPGDPVPLYLDKRSETLKVIQHLRNEAHRFGITHHRKRRGKSGLKTELSRIEGVGEKSIQKLLRAFKSVKRIKEADLAELEKVTGKSRAKKVYRYFH